MKDIAVDNYLVRRLPHPHEIALVQSWAVRRLKAKRSRPPALDLDVPVAPRLHERAKIPFFRFLTYPLDN